MDFPVETEVEKHLRILMAPHDQVVESGQVRVLMLSIKSVVDTMYAQGHHPEVIAWVIAQHAAAAVGAMKIAGVIRPALADALAADFTETLHRAQPGALGLGSVQ